MSTTTATTTATTTTTTTKTKKTSSQFIEIIRKELYLTSLPVVVFQIIEDYLTSYDWADWFDGHANVKEEKLISGSNVSIMDMAFDRDTWTLYTVDYFGKTLGTFDLQTNELTTFAKFGQSPHGIDIFKGSAYIVTSGTQDKKFRNGELLKIDLKTKKQTRLLNNLQYPNGIRIKENGDVYTVEAAGGSTSFGGNHCVNLFRNGKNTKLCDVVGPEGMEALPNGMLLVGSMGRSSPGTDGSVTLVNPVTKSVKKYVVRNLPSPHTLKIDPNGHLFVSGYADGDLNGLCMVKDCATNLGGEWKGIDSGKKNVTCSELGRNGEIFYATARGEKAIFRLTLDYQ